MPPLIRLALACHRAGRYDDARRLIEFSCLPASGDFGLLHHHVHLALAQELAAHQDEAISAGKPAVLLTALPRSASSFLSVCISEIIGVPIFRVSVGGFDDGRIVRNWAMQISRGGATTHEHFPGSVANLEAFAHAGARKIFVQIRDPRAAWWSFVHRAARCSDVVGLASSPLLWYANAIKWLTSWIEAARSSDYPLQVSFVPYDDLRLRPGDTIWRIFREVGYSVPDAEITRYFEGRQRSGRKPESFRVGLPDDWRHRLPPDLAAQFWQQTPQPVRDLLSMAE